MVKKINYGKLNINKIRCPTQNYHDGLKNKFKIFLNFYFFHRFIEIALVALI